MKVFEMSLCAHPKEGEVTQKSVVKYNRMMHNNRAIDFGQSLFHFGFRDKRFFPLLVKKVSAKIPAS